MSRWKRDNVKRTTLTLKGRKRQPDIPDLKAKDSRLRELLAAGRTTIDRAEIPAGETP